MSNFLWFVIVVTNVSLRVRPFEMIRTVLEVTGQGTLISQLKKFIHMSKTV